MVFSLWFIQDKIVSDINYLPVVCSHTDNSYKEIIFLSFILFLSPLLFIMNLIITIRYIKFETMIHMQVLILNIHANVI